MMSSDLRLFLAQMLRRPHEVVALAPSSEDLARAMAAAIPMPAGRVAELGPGTGKLTRAILARGVAAADLTLFELNPEFCARLRDRFPGVAVLNAPAQALPDHCAPGLSAVVSGLPLLSMSDAVQQAIVGAAFDRLAPGGLFIQFTYGRNASVAPAVQRALGLVARRGARVWNNLPPARVWTYRRA
jgi:phosphatidylethanolamine/phosphatidyl-N-methylethanolamine N-methyltransferase